MPDNVAVATPAPAAAPPLAAATPAVASPPAQPAAAPQAPAAASSPAPAAAGEPAKAADAAPAKPAVIQSLIGDEPAPDAAKPADAKPADAPADGAVVYDIKLPEGVQIDAPMMDQAKTMFAEAKVAPEAAQKFADFHVGQLTALKTQMENNQIEAWNTYITGKQQEVMADPVIGGTKFPEAKARIESGLRTFFGITDSTPANAPERKAHAEFIGVLKYTGAGSTLPMLRVLDKIASPRSEGRPAPVGGPSAPKRSPAEKMYPTKQAAE